jgi:voltage-gated potassium channel
LSNGPSHETGDRPKRLRPSTERRQAALDRFERAVELPLVLLALAMVPLILVPLLVHLPGSMDRGFVAADWFIWAVFAFEYVARLALTPTKWRFVRHQWPDLLIVALPFLRPLRIVRSARALRLLRLGRLVSFLSEIGQEVPRLFARHGLHYALLISMTVVVSTAGLVHAVEEGHGGTINSFGDALWWAVTTVTTVGYGDKYPVTAAGRGIAAFLMLSGIALFGVLTANIAAFFVERTQEETTRDPVVAKLDEVLERLAALEERLGAGSVNP